MLSKRDAVEQNLLEKQILYSVKNFAGTINCVFHNIDNVKVVLNNLLADHPEIFYVFDYQLKTIKNSVEIKPIYIYNRKEIITLNTLCQEKAQRVLRDAKKHVSDYEKTLFIHDSLSQMIKYSNKNGKACHTIIGALINGQAVCDGYSKAFKYLLDQTSIESLIVSGTACNQKSLKHENHSWNMVKIGGKWCHVDLTFNTSIRINDYLRYDYFGLSNVQINTDHTFIENMYPRSLGNEFEYYRRHHLYVNSVLEIKKLLLDSFSGRNTNFVLRLSPLIKPFDFEKRIHGLIIEVANQKKYYGSFRYSYNQYQNVIQISFE